MIKDSVLENPLYVCAAAIAGAGLFPPEISFREVEKRKILGRMRDIYYLIFYAYNRT